ncbi:MAG: hypothetical protein E7641_02340 [Ruminococcaceae bacterium]|nr:hypothetical protein [Oscillospiraceae bacterium]
MKAGFSRLEITPPLGVNLSGYFHYRAASEITTPLCVNTVAFSDDDGETAVIVSLDILELMMKDTEVIRNLISEKTGIPKNNIVICCTHTHFGPDVSGVFFPVGDAYVEIFTSKICDSVAIALSDMKSATAYTAKGMAEGISFIREYDLKDPSLGRVPENMIPIGKPDETLGLIKFVREDASDIAIVNFQTHPDVCGEYKFNYDWPGYVREFLESALCDVADGKGVKAICINGAQGDVNHVDIFKKLGGVEHAKHMARVIVGGVLGIYTYAEEIKTDKVFSGYKRIMANTVIPSQEEVELTHRLAKIWGKGTREERNAFNDYVKNNDDLIFKSIATVNRNLVMEGRDPVLPLDVCCIGIGDFALVTFPGEPYTEIGRRTKEASPFKMTMISCCANGSEAYFVTENFPNENPLESRDRFERGTAEKLRDAAIELTEELFK